MLKITAMAQDKKKLEKVEKLAPRLQIDNSIDGLRAYLSALNIRNKCRHPLFFVLRFDACVGLLYDTASVVNPIDDDASFFRNPPSQHEFKRVNALPVDDTWSALLLSGVAAHMPYAADLNAQGDTSYTNYCNRPCRLCKCKTMPNN